MECNRCHGLVGKPQAVAGIFTILPGGLIAAIVLGIGTGRLSHVLHTWEVILLGSYGNRHGGSLFCDMALGTARIVGNATGKSRITRDSDSDRFCKHALANVYVGRTVDYGVRFTTHVDTSIGGRVITVVDEFTIPLSQDIIDDPKKFRTAEQILMNAFGGKVQLLNKINASRKLFCIP